MWNFGTPLRRHSRAFALPTCRIASRPTFPTSSTRWPERCKTTATRASRSLASAAVPSPPWRPLTVGSARAPRQISLHHHARGHARPSEHQRRIGPARAPEQRPHPPGLRPCSKSTSSRRNPTASLTRRPCRYIMSTSRWSRMPCRPPLAASSNAAISISERKSFVPVASGALRSRSAAHSSRRPNRRLAGDHPSVAPSNSAPLPPAALSIRRRSVIKSSADR